MAIRAGITLAVSVLGVAANVSNKCIPCCMFFLLPTTTTMWGALTGALAQRALFRQIRV